ncbi:MAG: hypothetical protein Q9162_003632 [Coniocarpon cinnabarinum]
MVHEAVEQENKKHDERRKEESEAYQKFCFSQNDPDANPPLAPTAGEITSVVQRAWAELKVEEEQAIRDEHLAQKDDTVFKHLQSCRQRQAKQNDRTKFLRKQALERHPHLNKKILDGLEDEERKKGWVAVMKNERLFQYPQMYPALMRKNAPHVAVRQPPFEFPADQIPSTTKKAQRPPVTPSTPQPDPMQQGHHAKSPSHIVRAPGGSRPALGHHQSTTSATGFAHLPASQQQASRKTPLPQAVPMERVAIDATKGVAVAAPPPGSVAQIRPGFTRNQTAQPVMQQGTHGQQLPPAGHKDLPPTPSPALGKPMPSPAPISPGAQNFYPAPRPPQSNQQHLHPELPHVRPVYDPVQRDHGAQGRTDSAGTQVHIRRRPSPEPDGLLSPQENWQYCANSSPGLRELPQPNQQPVPMPSVQDHLPPSPFINEVNPVDEYQHRRWKPQPPPPSAKKGRRSSSGSPIAISRNRGARRPRTSRHVRFASPANHPAGDDESSDDWQDYRSSDESPGASDTPLSSPPTPRRHTVKKHGDGEAVDHGKRTIVNF